jgi:hypothetical protein
MVPIGLRGETRFTNDGERAQSLRSQSVPHTPLVCRRAKVLRRNGNIRTNTHSLCAKTSAVDRQMSTFLAQYLLTDM